MLRPQDSATRERKNLNGLWQFALDPDGQGQTERWYAGPLAGRARDGGAGQLQRHRSRCGRTGLLRRRLVPDAPSGCRGAGRVSASCCTSNRRPTGPRCGSTTLRSSRMRAATPRSRPTSPTMSRPGSRCASPALVNNTLHWQSIPPGVIEDTPGRKRQRYWHDFFNYAGIHRNVWLYATNPAHFTDVTITTDLDGANGVIDYAAQAENADALETKVILRDAEGQEITTGGGRAARLRAECAQVGSRRRLPLRSRDAAGGRGHRRGQLSPKRRGAHREGGRNPVPDQRRAVLLHWVWQA